MMSFRYINTLLFLLFFLAFRSQTTLVITNTGNGCATCADVILFQAETLANTGQNVTVNMNAPGLCTIGKGLFLSNGSITIQEDPTPVTTPQGFNTGGNNALSFVSYNNSCDITVKNISISSGAYGIFAQGIPNLIVDNVKFSATGLPVTIHHNDPITNTEIKNCDFDFSALGGPGYALRRYYYLNNSTNQNTLKINNNNLKDAVIDVYTNAPNDKIAIEMKNNYSSVSNKGWGTFIGSHCPGTFGFSTHYTNNYLMDVEIENNTDITGVLLYYPLNTWKIKNNVFDGKNVSATYIGIGSFNNVRPFKTSLLNTGSGYCNNQPFQNSNNTFINPPPTYLPIVYPSMWFSGNKGIGCALTEVNDLDVQGTISIEDNVSVRRCKIKGPFSFGGIFGGGSYVIPGRPIDSNSPINVTSFPTPNIVGNNLQFNISYNGITNANNNDLYIDFYKSNIAGELVDYIGQYYIPLGSITGNANNSIPIPASLNLTSSDKIAITLTGLHPSSSTNVVAMGTSIAFYHFNLSNIWNCQTPNIIATGGGCLGSPVNFSLGSCLSPPSIFTWNFGDGSSAIGANVSHVYTNPGTYLASVAINSPGQNTTYATYQIVVSTCSGISPCTDCIGTFQPSPGDYMVSLWVREDVLTQPQPTTYNNPKIQISFLGGPTNTYLFGTNSSKNKIIEGWQRIEEQFIIPAGATDIKMELMNSSATIDTYFDDLRIFPKDGQMKTYVYDPITLRLTSTLDENNYATFYEYDEEGKLIRVKKETEKGIMTIQENREAVKKK